MTQKNIKFYTPTVEQIKGLRKSLNLTQEEAGELVGRSRRRWQSWELGEDDMDGALWALFIYQTQDRDW